MFERFNDEARRTVVLAQEEARALDHGWIGTEHLLLAMGALQEGVAGAALSSMGVDHQAVRDRVVELLSDGEDLPRPSAHIPFTPRAKTVLEQSLREAIGLDHNYIGGEHLLLGLVGEGEGIGAQVLLQMGVDQARTRAQLGFGSED